MTETLKGFFLVPTPQNPDTGLWFIFHHESDGILAIDLTREHPDISWRHFAHISDSTPQEKIVLDGGPMQNDNALLVLHNDAGAVDSHFISPDFSFISRRFVLIEGQPPAITTADDVPSRISLAPFANFIVTLGFRLWDMDTLERELGSWQWSFLPATPDIVFNTPAQDRLQRARLLIN